MESNQVNKFNIPNETGFYSMYKSNNLRINVFINKVPLVYFLEYNNNKLHLYIKSNDIKVKCSAFYEICKYNKNEICIRWQTFEYGCCSIILTKNSFEFSSKFNFNMNNAINIVNNNSYLKLSSLDESVQNVQLKNKENDNKIIPISTNEMWQIGDELINSEEMNKRMNV